MSDYVMPKLGHLMEEAKVVLWRKAVGDFVKRDEILLEVETEKGVIEVESPFSGVLREIVTQPDQVAKVGEVLARYEEK